MENEGKKDFLFLGIPKDEVRLGLAQLTSDFFSVKFSDALISLSVQNVIQLSNAVSIKHRLFICLQF